MLYQILYLIWIIIYEITSIVLLRSLLWLKCLKLLFFIWILVICWNGIALLIPLLLSRILWVAIVNKDIVDLLEIDINMIMMVSILPSVSLTFSLFFFAKVNRCFFLLYEHWKLLIVLVVHEKFLWLPMLIIVIYVSSLRALLGWVLWVQVIPWWIHAFSF